MSKDLQNFALNLLPRPKSVSHHDGYCSLSTEFSAVLHITDSRIRKAVDRLKDEIRNTISEKVISQPDAKVTIHIHCKPNLCGHEYTLTITPDRINLAGGSAAGCFYGLQTLLQLIRTSATDGTVLPCGVIKDHPDFQTRGLLHDITRGKVPTLDTLKLLVDRLALLKINQLQLYIEHAFCFSFDPEICNPDEGLTPDEINELDCYCKDKFIDLVPAVATFGHMGRILSMPKYRHLAEIESTQDWSDMHWPERMRGFTLDCMNPQSHKLIEQMWTDILNAFSSPTVNICGDEPWDLGKGLNHEKITHDNRSQVYLEHIRRTHEICSSKNRRTQFWSDVVINYPDLFDQVPKDSTVLHWGYDDKTDYNGTSRFTKRGLQTFVCPGTSGFKRIINAIDLAERNISKFARVGQEAGAAGLLNTDWGDHGHFNTLACSWHGIALGACCSWRVDHPTGREFDSALMNCLYNTDDPTLFTTLRSITNLTNGGETWRWLYQSARTIENDRLPSQDQIELLKEQCQTARQLTRSLTKENMKDADDFNELTLALRFSELLAEKLTIIHPDTPGNHSARKQWSHDLLETANAYADVWHQRNKSSGIGDISDALTLAAKEITQR